MRITATASSNTDEPPEDQPWLVDLTDKVHLGAADERVCVYRSGQQTYARCC